MQASTLIAELKLFVGDAGEGWTDPEWIQALNRALLTTIIRRPDAYTKRETVMLSAGSLQVLPAQGHRLLDVICNHQKSAVVQTSGRDKDMFSRGWRAGAPSTDVEEWLYDARDPVHFEVAPPATPGAQLTILYAALPPPLETPATEIQVLDVWAPALFEHCLYQYYSRDTEDTPNVARGELHLRAWATALDAKATGEAVADGARA